VLFQGRWVCPLEAWCTGERDYALRRLDETQEARLFSVSCSVSQAAGFHEKTFGVRQEHCWLRKAWTIAGPRLTPRRFELHFGRFAWRWTDRLL